LRLFATTGLPYIKHMIKQIRPFAAIALALMLVFTAQSMAVARGMAGANGMVVLCTEAGAVSVLVDADGQPVGPTHICPDCTLSLIAAVAPPALLLAHPMGRAETLQVAYLSVIAERLTLPFSARDPPVLI